MAFAAPLFAQDRQVHIIVKDPEGGALPGATVSLLDAQGKVIESVRSGASGEVTWTALQVGVHHFGVELPGFEPAAFSVLAGGPDIEPVTVVLGLATMGETIVVPARKGRRRRWWLFGL